MATEVCEDRAGMNREGANFTRFTSPVKFHSKENVRGFRLAVSLPPVVSAMLEARIVKVNSGALVTA